MRSAFWLRRIPVFALIRILLCPLDDDNKYNMHGEKIGSAEENVEAANIVLECLLEIW